MNGPTPYPWQQPYRPQPVQGPSPMQQAQQPPQQALGPAPSMHSQLVQALMQDPQKASPQSAPELGLDMVSQALQADTMRQRQAAANTANQSLPGLNSALGDLDISPVSQFTASDPNLRQGGLSGLLDSGRRLFSGWGG